MPVLISWSATSNSGEGICSYKLKQNVNTRTYTAVKLSSATANSVVVNLAAGAETMPQALGFQLTANDCDGTNTVDTLAPFLVQAHAQKTRTQRSPTPPAGSELPAPPQSVDSSSRQPPRAHGQR